MKRLLGFKANGEPIYYDHRKARSIDRKTKHMTEDERIKEQLKWIDKEMGK
jgi:hypothetical protein